MHSGYSLAAFIIIITSSVNYYLCKILFVLACCKLHLIILIVCPCCQLAIINPYRTEFLLLGTPQQLNKIHSLNSVHLVSHIELLFSRQFGCVWLIRGPYLYIAFSNHHLMSHSRWQTASSYIWSKNC